MRTKKSHSEPSPTRLQLLIDEYKSARDDERAESGLLVTILQIVLASALAAAVFLAGPPEKYATAQPYGSTFWVTILAPVVLLLPIIHATTLWGTRTTRSFYMRALEREIRSELENSDSRRGPSGFPTRFESYPRLKLFTLKELELKNTAVGTSSKGGYTLLIFSTACFTTTFIFLVINAYYHIRNINDMLAAFATLFYGTVAIALANKTLQNSLGGRSFFFQNVIQTHYSCDNSLLPQSPLNHDQTEAIVETEIQRTPSSLKLLTKPDDLLKIIHETVGTLFAYFLISFHTSNRVHDGHLLMLILMILAFEMLVYQTRYLVNDVLGRNEEGVLKSRGQRGKMTGSPEHVLAAVRSLMLRSALIFVSVVLALFSGVGLTFTIGIALLALVTAVYEAVRRAEAKTAHSPRAQNILARLVFILVSLGIPLRFVFGFAVYSELYFGSLDGALRWMAGGGWAFAPLTLWFFCFSLTSVPPTWALEGLFEARSFDKGALQFQWRAEGKRHVWISLGCFLRPLGIAPGDFPCPLSNGLGDRELSGHECWTDISDQSTPLFQRLRKWMVAPWVISTTGGVIATHLFLSSLYNAPTPPRSSSSFPRSRTSSSALWRWTA